MVGEYNSKNFNILYKEGDIIKQTTTPHVKIEWTTERNNWTFVESMWL